MFVISINNRSKFGKISRIDLLYTESIKNEYQELDHRGTL